VQRDKEGRLLPDFEQHKMIAWIITAAGFGPHPQGWERWRQPKRKQTGRG
jgi:hypothetical protein